MKQRHHSPVQVIRKLVEGEKLLAQGETTEETDPFSRATDPSAVPGDRGCVTRTLRVDRAPRAQSARRNEGR
jgi:hypothetical protein